MLDPDPRNVFPKTCLMIKPVLSGREKTSVDFIRPKSDPLSPEKKSTEKNAKSLANMYRFDEEILGFETRDLKF